MHGLAHPVISTAKMPNNVDMHKVFLARKEVIEFKMRTYAREIQTKYEEKRFLWKRVFHFAVHTVNEVDGDSGIEEQLDQE